MNGWNSIKFYKMKKFLSFELDYSGALFLIYQIPIVQ